MVDFLWDHKACKTLEDAFTPEQRKQIREADDDHDGHVDFPHVELDGQRVNAAVFTKVALPGAEQAYAKVENDKGLLIVDACGVVVSREHV